MYGRRNELVEWDGRHLDRYTTWFSIRQAVGPRVLE